jgi:hypothetical protein
VRWRHSHLESQAATPLIVACSYVRGEQVGGTAGPHFPAKTSAETNITTIIGRWWQTGSDASLTSETIAAFEANFDPNDEIQTSRRPQLRLLKVPTMISDATEP